MFIDSLLMLMKHFKYKISIDFKCLRPLSNKVYRMETYAGFKALTEEGFFAFIKILFNSIFDFIEKKKLLALNRKCSKWMGLLGCRMLIPQDTDVLVLFT